MAVAVAGTVASATGSAGTSSSTFAWNNSASANYLVVGVSSWDGTAGDAVVSGVTYNSVAMSSIGSHQDAGNNTVSLWGLASPATGSNNVVVTMAGNCDEFISGAIGFSGVDTGSPTGTFVSADGTSNTANPGTVTSQTDALVIGVLYTNNNPAVGAGQTQQWEVFAYGATYGAGCTEPGASSVTVTWTFASNGWCCGAVSIKPSGGTFRTARLPLLGAGRGSFTA